MKRIGVVGNPKYRNVSEALDRLLKIAPKHEFELFLAPELRVGRKAEVGELPKLPEEIDLLVTLGGDGALLGGARWAGPAGTPVLGVNLGRLGFLTASGLEELEESLARIAGGDFVLDTRMGLEARLEHRRDEAEPFYALNDAVLHRGGLVRVVHLKVWVDEDEVGLYRGDGVIVATPTGSTAYSLSAGGPIVDPRLDAIVVTPICPHTLAVRPLVLRASAQITLEVVSSPEDLILTIDGQVGSQLKPGDRVVVCKAPEPVRLVRLPGQSFFSLLRRKLKWGDVSEGMKDDH
ncbi:MAG: NAD(+)/NADH kinase [Gemmatimonadota bacterium]|nr:MAG: NAD(+)/NADH kinase [Gemmatimonadota bacterium]